MKAKQFKFFGLILGGVLITLILGFLIIPKLLAGDAVADDLHVNTEVSNQVITAKILDTSEADSKVVVPIPAGLTYQPTTNNNAGVTYDAANQQVVIDWIAGQTKQASIQLLSTKVGSYQLQAQTVRTGQTVVSPLTNVQIKSIADAPLAGKATSSDVMSASTVVETQQQREGTSGTVGTCDWYIDETNTLHIGAGEIEYGGYAAPWDDKKSTIKKMVIDGPIKLGGNVRNLFSGMSKVTLIENMQDLDTKKVTSMSGMFYNDKSLQSVDLSHFDTSNVTSMNAMFNGTYVLKEINVSQFNTSSVTDMSSMFQYTAGLSQVNVDNFDTSKVTSMANMFANSTLTSLDVSQFNTENVVNMSGMFAHDMKLTTLELGQLDTGKVTNMSNMFDQNWVLASLDVSHFDTHNVINMSNMFHQCQTVEQLDVSGFDTSKVTNMSMMFQQCDQIKSLDLTHFDTSYVTDMSWMFAQQPLKKLDVSSFNTEKVTNFSAMFKSAEIEALDLSHFDIKENANIQSMLSGTDEMWSLTLGANTRLNNSDNADIPAITSSGYSGFWESASYPKLYNSADFMTNYDGSTMHGEWHWQKDQVSLEVKDSTIYVGDSWQAKDNLVAATDTQGKPLDISQLTVTGTVDTNQPGVYPVKYINGTHTEIANITVEAGVLSFKETPKDITYQTTKIGTKMQVIKRQNADFNIQIVDHRQNKGDWTLLVQLIKPFTNNNQEQLINSLFYREENQADQVVSDQQAMLVHRGQVDLTTDEYSVDWTENQGLLMKVLPGTAKVGQYQATLQWTLADVPI